MTAPPAAARAKIPAPTPTVSAGMRHASATAATLASITPIATVRASGVAPRVDALGGSDWACW